MLLNVSGEWSLCPKSPTKDMVICVKHWPVNHKKYKKKRHQVPVDQSFIFLTPNFFDFQSLDAPPRNQERR